MAGDEFAGLLRELKERSGLSYGALAKRLHVSTSTLHRYVNGDAVPADYAPVERLARVCRATPDELMELHRRWVLADALRGKKGPGPGRTGAGDPADDAPEAEAEAEAEAEVVAGAETVDASGAVSRAGADDTADGTADGRPASEGGAAVGPVPVRPGRLWSRRSAVLAGVGAVVVTAVVSGVLAVQLGSGSRDDDAQGGAVAVGVPPAARPSATGTTPGARHGSASPSTAHRSPRPSGSTVGGAVDENGVTDDGAAGADDGAGAPTVVVDPYRFDDPCSQHYLVNRPAQQVPPPPNESDARGWVTALGGVPSGEQLLSLTVQGTGKATVVLKALHVRVLDKSAPLAWNDYAMGVGCGGGVETTSFTVDLDAGRPAVALKGGQRAFPFKVSESDPEVFSVFADTQAHDVSWYLELDWSSGTKSGTVRVDDHGKPFRTSGNVGRPAYAYPLGGSEWGKAAPPG
ncbi:helix-turn-helix domain-containing protein [Streptomyces sp. NBC_01281]|uniref:helix-turn-helix domain-containing protein n=1 Tax=Streptomyces sp. NBC_01281 TaxID=2903811 RepID=UPI002E12D52E|nr:helix-turn-helix domain-containing protein [Streptomyces sp. NBC_01281]